jgi:FtsP/CotA-like multicopper oxidase with cupredoxin domain
MAKYDATYWGGTPFTTLQMMRDADDVGESTDPTNPFAPRINYKKEGLFDPSTPLFSDMIAGNYEEWTVYNRTFSDHPFHLHQNHVLITKINETTLPQPEWHDTLVVPAARCGSPLTTCQGGGQPTPGQPPPLGGMGPDINHTTPGSLTFRVYFNPITVGCFVAHCHTIDHEDLGMMQRFDILPANGQSSGCALDGNQASKPNLRMLLASRSNSELCSSSAPPPLSYTPWIR